MMFFWVVGGIAGYFVVGVAVSTFCLGNEKFKPSGMDPEQSKTSNEWTVYAGLFWPITAVISLLIATFMIGYGLGRTAFYIVQWWQSQPIPKGQTDPNWRQKTGTAIDKP